MERMVPDKIKKMSGRIKLHGRNANEEMEIIEMTMENTFSDRVRQLMEKLAGTHFGQMVMVSTDRVLQVIEETAKWSLPQDESSKPLVRPLPWLFFLPLIVSLRIVRVWLSVICVLVGNDFVTGRSMVYFIQDRRRYLRALRIHGLRAIRVREMKYPLSYTWDKSNPFAKNIEKIIGNSINKPEQENNEQTINNPSTNKSLLNEKTKEKENAEKNSGKQLEVEEPEKPEDAEESDDLEDEDCVPLTVSEMLDKFANEDSELDSDYIPTNKEEDEALYSTSSIDDDDIKEDSFEHDEKFIQMMKTLKADIKNTEKSITNGQINMNHIHPHKENQLENGETETNGSENNGTAEKANGNENRAATAEAAVPSTLNTPLAQKLNHLAAPQFAENDTKSTPGHETAAALKPHLDDAAQTGSLQDFHSYFHPAPIVQDFSNKAKTSTSTGAVEADSSVSPAGNPATNKHQRNSHHSTHNKNHQNHRHYNAKNRNKKRR